MEGTLRPQEVQAALQVGTRTVAGVLTTKKIQTLGLESQTLKDTWTPTT